MNALLAITHDKDNEKFYKNDRLSINNSKRSIIRFILQNAFNLHVLCPYLIDQIGYKNEQETTKYLHQTPAL